MAAKAFPTSREREREREERERAEEKRTTLTHNTHERKENVAGALATGISVHARRDFAKLTRGRSGKSRQSTGGNFVGKPSNDDEE